MKILDFAESILKVRLTYHQRELLTLLDTNKNSYVHFVKPRSHGIMVVHEIYKKYNERVNAS